MMQMLVPPVGNSHTCRLTAQQAQYAISGGTLSTTHNTFLIYSTNYAEST